MKRTSFTFAKMWSDVPGRGSSGVWLSSVMLLMMLLFGNLANGQIMDPCPGGSGNTVSGCPATGPYIEPAGGNCEAPTPNFRPGVSGTPGAGYFYMGVVQAPPPGFPLTGLGNHTVEVGALFLNTTTMTFCSVDCPAITVTVVDGAAPSIGCPSIAFVPANANCQVVLNQATIMGPLVTSLEDNCADSTDITVTASPVGPLTGGCGPSSTSVTLTATDPSGMMSTCVVNVNVIDTTAPTVTFPVFTSTSTDTLYLGTQGVGNPFPCGNLTPDLITDPTNLLTGAGGVDLAPQSDNCDPGAFTIDQNPAPGTPYTLPHRDSCGIPKIQHITVGVQDCHGNRNEHIYVVIIVDDDDPVISTACVDLPVQPTLIANDSCVVIIPDLTDLIDAADNCAEDSNLVITQIPAPGPFDITGLCPPDTTIDAMWIVADCFGNADTLECPDFFSFTDVVPPQILCPGMATGFSGAYDIANWTANLNGSLTAQVNTANAPASVSLVSSEDGGGLHITSFCTTAGVTDTIYFSWSYSSANSSPFWDPFGYSLNGVYTQLTNDGGSLVQNGTASVILQPGDVFCFEQRSIDQCCGAATTSVSFYQPLIVLVPFNPNTCQHGADSLTIFDVLNQGVTVVDPCNQSAQIIAVLPNMFMCPDIGKAGLFVSIVAEDCFGNRDTTNCGVEALMDTTFNAGWGIGGNDFIVCPDEFPICIDLGPNTPACGTWSGDIAVTLTGSGSTCDSGFEILAGSFPDLDNDGVPDPGSYSVTYTVGAPGCHKEETHNIIVSPQFDSTDAALIADTTVCMEATEIFYLGGLVDSGGVVGGYFTISLGGALQGQLLGSLFQYLGGDGDLTVAYVLTDCDSVVETDTVIISIDEKPDGYFSMAAHQCQDEGIATPTITGVPAGASISFSSIPSGFIINPATGEFDPTAGPLSGEFVDVVVTMQVTNGVCDTFYLSQVITVKASGDPGFGIPDTICESAPPLVLTLTNPLNDGGVNPLLANNVTWTGTGVTDNGTTGSFNPQDLAPGYYTICVTVGSPSCEETECHDIFVSQDYTPDEVALIGTTADSISLCLSYDDVLTFADYLDASALVGGDFTVTDILPNTLIGTINPNSYEYNGGCGTLQVIYFFPDDCVPTFDTVYIVIEERPDVGGWDLPNEICFTSAPITVSYSGQPEICGNPGVFSGDGITDTGTGAIAFFDPAAAGEGTHTIQYEIGNPLTGCYATFFGEVYVKASSPADFVIPGFVCANDTVFLSLPNYNSSIDTSFSGTAPTADGISEVFWTGGDGYNADVIDYGNGRGAFVGYKAGTYTVCVLTGEVGCLEYQCRQITVDDVPPVMNCAPLVRSFGNDPGLCTFTMPGTGFDVTATDNCILSGVNSPASLTLIHNYPVFAGHAVDSNTLAGATFPVGITQVIWTAIDTAGNSSNCTIEIVIEDVEGPSVTTCPSDTTISTDANACGAVFFYDTPTFADNCDSTDLEGVLVSGYAPGTLFPLGTTTVTWIYTDLEDNSTDTCSFTVTVVDSVAPIAVCVDTFEVALDENGESCILVTEVDNGSADNCGVVTREISRDGIAYTDEVCFDCSDAGDTVTIYLRITDAAGNVTICTTAVSVVDEQIPDIECPGNKTVTADNGTCSSFITMPAPTVTDNCPTTIVATSVTGPLQGSQEVPANASNGTGTVTVTYAGGTAINLEVEFSNLSSNVTAAHLHLGNFGVSGGVILPLAAFPTGVTSGTFSETIALAPAHFVNLLAGELYLNIHTTNYPGGELRGQINLIAPNNLPGGVEYPVGTTMLTYTATDESGNSESCSFMVIVIDEVAPTITCPPSPVVRNNDPGVCSYTVQPADAAAFDAVGADNCAAVTVTHNYAPAPSPNTLVGAVFPVGSVIVTWIATDAFGNQSVICATTYTVVDNEAPVITSCGNPNSTFNTNPGKCTWKVPNTSFDPTWTDNCPGAVATHNFAMAPDENTLNAAEFPVGTTTVIWTVTDAAGNIDTCIRTITVIDNQPPVFQNCPATMVMIGNDPDQCSGKLNWATPVATDNCALVITYGGPMSGTQEVPPNNTAATGSIVATLGAGNVLNLNVTYSGLTTPATAAHIHTGAPGVNGPVTIDLASFGFVPGTTSGTINGAIPLTGAQVATLNSGNFYVNIHNATFPGGQIRGQINSSAATQIVQVGGPTSGSTVPVCQVSTIVYKATDVNGNMSTCSFEIVVVDTEKPEFDADIVMPGNVTVQCNAVPAPFILAGQMSGSQETPPNNSTAGGSVTGVLTGTTLNLTVAFAGLTTPVTAAHIHQGGLGVAGPVIIDLVPLGFPTGVTSGVFNANVNLTPAQVALLNAGNLYVNIHNATFPGGEIRGQISLTTDANDNCTPANQLIITYSQTSTQCTNNAQCCFYSYTITRTWTITDRPCAPFQTAGNSLVHTQVITVVDTQAPVLAACQNGATPVLNLTLDKFGVATLPDAATLLALLGASDNCAPNSVLTVTASQSTFGCANVPGPTNVTITVTDPCGNAATCVIQVFVAQGIGACTPIYDVAGSQACVCLNNATTLDNGQFSEFIQIKALAGQTWTVQSSTGMFLFSSPAPPAAPIPVPNGTALTAGHLDGVNNDGDGQTDEADEMIYYTIRIKSVDGINLMATFVNNLNQTVNYMNVCYYPTPVVTLFDPYCLNTPAFVPDVTDLYAGDNAYTSITYMVDGVTVDSIDPSVLAPGVHTLKVTVDAGAAESSRKTGNPLACIEPDGDCTDGRTDPGCVQSITTFFTIVTTQAAVTCDDLVNVSIPAECVSTVLPDDVLEGTYLCFDDYFVVIEYPACTNTHTPANVIDSTHVGLTLNYKLMHPISGNVCWGQIKVEDKLKPTVVCPPNVQIPCTVDPDSLVVFQGLVYVPSACVGGTFQVQTIDTLYTGEPDIEDCSHYTWEYTDDYQQFTCAQNPTIVDRITRTFVVTDEWGNQDTCIQIIERLRGEASQVAFPPDVSYFCNNLPANFNPPITGWPKIGGHNLTTTGTGSCGLGVSYVDQTVNLCPGSYKIVRTWTIFDWCPANGGAPTQTTYIQYIKVEDLPPIIVLPCGGTQNDTLHVVYTQYTQAIINGIVVPAVTTASFKPGDVLTDCPVCASNNTVTVLEVVPTPAPNIKLKVIVTTVAPPCELNATEPGNPPHYACSTLGPVPFADIDARCNALVEITVETPAGSTTNGGMIPAPGLPIGGPYLITYRAEDACGNITEKTVSVMVEDQVVPVAICDEITDVNIGSDGVAEVFADTYDDGSWDNCCLDHFEVRRMEAPCGVTPNDTQFGPSVVFCCADAGLTRTVVFRAVDCNGNFNDCMVQVQVNDKIPPILTNCPAGQRITCDWYSQNLEATLFGIENNSSLTAAQKDAQQDAFLAPFFGSPTFIDNCQPIITPQVTLNIDQCLEGRIIRTFTARDQAGNNAPQSCVQTIFVDHVSDFVVQFPADATINCGTTPPDFGEPKIFFETCELVAVSFEDELFTVVPDACYKLLRTWTVINWCVVGAEIDQEVVESSELQFQQAFPAEPCDFDGELGCNSRTFRDSWRVNPKAKPGAANATNQTGPDTDPDTDPWDGFITYQQVIKVQDTVDPVFTNCTIPDVCIDGTTCATTLILPTPPIQDCSPSVTITAQIDFGSGYISQGVNGFGPYANVPPGTYPVRYTAVDNCNNQTVCNTSVKVKDCKLPTPYCKNGLVIELMVTNPPMVQAWASDFNAGSFDNCPGALKFSFTTNPADSGIVFDCEDVGTSTINIYVTDAAGNQDFCETQVVIQANQNQCNPGSPSVAGTVSTEANQGVQDVNVQLSGTNQSTFMTGQDGTYSFSVTQGGDYTLTPVKDEDPLNGVTTFDLVIISKHILGVAPLSSPYKMIAADANNSKTITTFDLVQLRKLILFIDNDFPNNTSWRFVDKDYVFPTPTNPWSAIFPEIINFNNVAVSQLSADFVAIKVGDVNGSAQPSFAAVNEDRTMHGTLVFAVDQAKMEAGKEYTVEFKAKDFNVQGYQFTLNFDRNAVEFVQVNPAVAGVENFGLTLLDKGVITTSWNGNAQPVNGDVMFSLTFKALKNADLSDVLNVNSRYTVAEAYNQAGELLNVSLAFNGRATAGAFELYQNTPNPFSVTTVIGFNLPESVAATLTITDVSGKVVKVVNRNFVKGYNEVKLERKELPATGILYYQLDTPTDSATKMMLLMD